MSTFYQELRRIDAPDEQRYVTIEEKSCLFRFVAYQLITSKDYDGVTRTRPSPTQYSGLYASAEEAERAARKEFPWLV